MTPVKLTVKTGQPFTEIMTTAADENVSIIILGSHGRSNIGEMLLGSISENVIRHAGVPVLVISREMQQDACACKWRKGVRGNEEISRARCERIE